MSAPVNAKLIPLPDGKPIQLVQDRMIVGRRNSCAIRLPYPNVSSVHCELDFRIGHWYILDLNSTNGVKVNGARVHEQLLMPGDEITVAKRCFRIEYDQPAGGVGGTK
jgi:pSer/pThr/pTyr-binding forkhead associated (FHA) protein